MAYDLADIVPLTITIRDSSGAVADGGTVVLTIELPDGTAVTPAVSHPGTGVYQVDYVPTMAGRHVAQWVCTGSNASGYTDVFDVRPARPGYIVSLADTKLQLNMTSTGDDEELRGFIEAATAVIEEELGRAVVRRSFVEEHAACGELLLNWTPVVSLTSVATVDGATTWNTADLHVSPSGILTAKAGAAALVGDIAVSYIAGPTVVPANWTLAAKIIIQHLWDTQRGVKGAAHAGGTETPGAGFTRYGFAIPNRAKELLTGRAVGV